MRFADTSFWIGLQVVRDRRHADAAVLWQQNREPIRISDLVIGETWTFLNRRAGHAAAVGFLDLVEKSRMVTIIDVDGTVAARAWQWLRRHDERVCSYVEATSFELMRRERISEALAFDGDFAAAGFVEVRPS